MPLGTLYDEPTRWRCVLFFSKLHSAGENVLIAVFSKINNALDKHR